MAGLPVKPAEVALTESSMSIISNSMLLHYNGQLLCVRYIPNVIHICLPEYSFTLLCGSPHHENTQVAWSRSSRYSKMLHYMVIDMVFLHCIELIPVSLNFLGING
jgi:hypothetical protein